MTTASPTVTVDRDPEEIRVLDARDTELHIAFLQGIIDEPSRLDDIPNGATLMLIPDDDPALAAYNRERGWRALLAGDNVYFRHVHKGLVVKPDDRVVPGRVVGGSRRR
jgi:hypothetical protein